MTAQESLTEAARPGIAALDALVGAGVRLGRSMIDAMGSTTPVSDAVHAVGSEASRVDLGLGTLRLPQLGAATGGCGCTIPDACFLPEKLPPVTAHGCPGATMRLRVAVTNDWPASRTVAVRATGHGAKAVQVEPVQQAIGPYETETFTATVHLPDDGTGPGSVLLWVRGCRDHVVRWQVTSSDGGCSCVHEVAVTDKPDTLHHWYDHFYREPCCRPQGRIATRVPVHG